MNNKEKEVLRLLSMFKYLTLKGNKNKISYSGMFFSQSSLSLEIPENSLTEPDVDKIEISRLQINFNGQHNKIKRTITVDFGYGNSIEKEMKKSQGLTEYNANFYKYVFYSDEYRRLTDKKQMEFWSEFTKYNQEPTYARTSYLFKCVVIQIHVTKKTIFETYMNRPYGSPNIPDSWKYYFNQAVIEALAGDFARLDKYDYKIYKDEISLVDRKNLLIKLTEQFWGDWDGDGLNEFQMFRNLVESCPDSHKAGLYNAFFEKSAGESAKLYRTAFSSSKLGKSLPDKIAVLTWLIQTFYFIQSASDLNIIQNKIINLPQDKIIPIFNETILHFKHVEAGPDHKIDYLPNGIRLNDIEIIHVKTTNIKERRELTSSDNRPIKKKYTLPNGTRFNGKIFEYNEIIGGYACFNKIDIGIVQGKIYALPAFAIFEIHDIFLLKNKISFYDLVGKLINIAAIIIPFFKLVQGTKVMVNLLAFAIGVSEFILTDDFIRKVKQSNNNAAIAFVYSYKFFVTFYGIKNLRKAYKTHKMFMVKDCESLIELWGQANTIKFFVEYKNMNDPDYLQIDADMFEISKFIKQVK